MSNPVSSERKREAKAELRAYVVGFALAIALTAAAFAIVAFKLLPQGLTLAAIGVLALVQIAVHFHHFLHIDFKKSHRDDLQLVLFTGLIVMLMVGGTIWITASQFARM